MNNNQTALQVTDFNFYGDDLIALKDNATGEIFTSINSVLKGIGFTDRNQIRKRRDKWINDSVMQQDINNLKHPEPLPKKRYSYWATKMFSKYQLLTDYFHISNKELYKQLFNEMKNTYPDIDLNQYVDDYCYEKHLDSCYTLDVIEHTLPLRDIYESLVDDLLERYNLASSIRSAPKTKTIFDKN